MNQLAKTQPTTISGAIRQGLDDTLISDLKIKISQAAQYRGTTLAEPDLAAAAAAYLNDLRTEFPRLGLKEVDIIINNGIRKKYGEYYGINAGTLYDWTRAYVNEGDHQRYLDAQVKALPVDRRLARKNQKSQSEIDADIIRLINEDYAAYRSRKAPAKAERGSLSAALGKTFGSSDVRYPVGHPLFDPGRYKEQWLHGHGFSGTLKEIFNAAAAEGKESITIH